MKDQFDKARLLAGGVEARSRHVMLVGYASLVIFVLFLILVGVNRLGKLQSGMESLISHEQVAIQMLFQMQESARTRAVLLYRIANMKDPFERDELIHQHAQLRVRFAEARQKLADLQLDETEAVRLGQVNGYVEISSELQSRVLDMLVAGKTGMARELLTGKAVPAQNNLIDTIRLLLEYEIDKSQQNKQVFRQLQIQIGLLILGGGGSVLCFVLIIAVFINRKMARLFAELRTSANQLQEANNRLDLMNKAVDQHGIVSIADAAGYITYVNGMFCAISEYSSDELIGRNHRIIKSGVHGQAFFDEMWRTISKGKIWQGEVCNRKKHGGLYWVLSTIVPYLDENGLPEQYISIRTDITHVKEAEQGLIRGKQELEMQVRQRTADLSEREELLRGITNAAQDAVLMIDGEGQITHWNPAAENMFGYTLAELKGGKWLDLIVPSQYREALKTSYETFRLNGRGPLVGKVTELDALKHGGAEFPVEVSVSSVQIHGQWHAVAIVRDITVRKMAEENLRHLAATDALTGAYNRRRFNEALQHEIALSRRFGEPFNLILFDVDHFKRVNDFYGHPAGDQVLFKLALLVSRHIRTTDIFARWGGEEFAILSTHTDDFCSDGLAEKLRALIESFEFSEVGGVTCSFGVAQFRDDDDQESLIRRADLNLYKAKESGRNRVVCD